MLALFVSVGIRERRDVQLAEGPAEGDQLRITQVLTADHEHEVLGQRFAQAHACALVQIAHIAATDLGAERRIDR